MTSESRFYLHVLPDGSADWGFWRPGEPAPEAWCWFQHLSQAQEAVRTHNAILRANRDRAAQPALDQKELFS